MGTSTCNATATIVIDPDEQVCRTLTCDYQAGHHKVTKHHNSEARFLWEDDTPGATPHRDAGYRVRRYSRHFQVTTSDDPLVAAVATFFSGDGGHPDPEGAAKAEAARLNGEDEPREGRLSERITELVVERDRYREALERVANTTGRTAGGERVSLLSLLHELNEVSTKALHHPA